MHGVLLGLRLAFVDVLFLATHESFVALNDLAVAAVLALRDKPWFARMRFTFVGDGPLFEAILAPLRPLANVSIRRGFLRQEEIARLHGEHGVFLVPTRLDTQGVSRDEAMASALVPVTNTVYAVPEFGDAHCAGLAPADDAAALAREIAAMVEAIEDCANVGQLMQLTAKPGTH
jgi:glycosyltransferase involved in cell wall biosynthesis